jgi:hypothetical protein
MIMRSRAIERFLVFSCVILGIAPLALATDVILENAQVKVVFSSNAFYGYVPASILRKPNDGLFTFSPTHLWEVDTWTGAGTPKETWRPGSVTIGSTSASIVQYIGGKRLELRWNDVHAPGPPERTERMDVLLSATLPNTAVGVDLKIDVTLRNAALLSIHSVVSPRLSVNPLHAAGQRANERATLPTKSGAIFDDPVTTMNSPSLAQGRFHPGNFSHQLFTYYDASDLRLLYVQPRDGTPYLKAASFYSDGQTIRFEHRAYGLTPLTGGAGYSSPYVVEMSLIPGDWFDAVKRYRTWAKTQPYTANGIIGSLQNTAFSAAMRSCGLFDHVAVCQGNFCAGGPPGDPNCPAQSWPLVPQALANWTSAFNLEGIAVRAGNWSVPQALQCDGPTPDPGDPAPGVRQASIDSTGFGSVFAPYVMPLTWDTDDPNFPSASPYVLIGEDGFPQQDGGIFPGQALMCTGTTFWKDKFKLVFNEVRTEGAFPGMYLDVWGGFPSPVCYSATHGHSAGDPTVFSAGQVDEAQQLRSLARSQDPNFFLMTENVNELTMRVTELQFGQLLDLEYNAHVHPAPMFQAIYKPYVYTTYFNGYIASLQDDSDCDWVRESNIFYQAMNYIWGNLPHVTEAGVDVYGPLVGSNPSAQHDYPILSFIGMLARSYRQVRKFVAEGEIERLNVVSVGTEFPPACARCQDPCGSVSWVLTDQQPWIFSTLRHSLVDNQWAVILVNWKLESKSITFRIPPQDVGQTGTTVTLVPICIDGVPCPTQVVLTGPNYEATLSVPSRLIQAFRIVVS